MLSGGHGRASAEERGGGPAKKPQIRIPVNKPRDRDEDAEPEAGVKPRVLEEPAPEALRFGKAPRAQDDEENDPAELDRDPRSADRRREHLPPVRERLGAGD